MEDEAPIREEGPVYKIACLKCNNREFWSQAALIKHSFFCSFQSCDGKGYNIMGIEMPSKTPKESSREAFKDKHHIGPRTDILDLSRLRRGELVQLIHILMAERDRQT